MNNPVMYGLIDPYTQCLRYIGFTDNPKRRLREHHRASRLTAKTYKNNWIKFLLLNGKRAEMIVLEDCWTNEELPLAEVELIAYYKSIGCDLINGTPGGDGLPKGFKHSEETRKKMSLSHKGHQVWNKGLRTSEETLKKISESLKGRKAWNKNKSHRLETRLKMSQAQKARFAK